ncbi:C40 family peptidase [Thermobifida halotolerans]|uniref:C40 family peptidase n=1 Tax=Thermobifida halotolerans TaxID=483545 RepID=A0A399G0Y4_9ACTN|nr:C40 family peptidase [Thermobifida halotolerans]UOE19258.1 C40 family peptidase [Thermobifida halotolerans]
MFCSEGFGRSQRDNTPRLIGRAATTFSALALAATVSVATATPVTGAAHRADPGAESAQEEQHVRGNRNGDRGSSTAEEALRHAESRIGAPYRWGAAGPNAFDCSGLVQWSYRQAGVTLKRTTRGQVTQGQPVSRSDLRPGDLVFFYSGPSHVGIYVGGDKMIHSPNSGKRVQIVPMAHHYDRNFHSARRVA